MYMMNSSCCRLFKCPGWNQVIYIFFYLCMCEWNIVCTIKLYIKNSNLKEKVFDYLLLNLWRSEFFENDSSVDTVASRQAVHPPHDPPIRSCCLSLIRCSPHGVVNFAVWKTGWILCSDKHRRGHAQTDTSNGKLLLLESQQRGFCVAKVSRLRWA